MAYSEELQLDFKKIDNRLIFEDGVEYSGGEVRQLMFLKKTIPSEKYKKALTHIHKWKGAIPGLVINDMHYDKELAKV